MLQFSCRFAFLSTLCLANWTPKILKHANSVLESFERFSRMISKLILIILSCAVQSWCIFSETQRIVLFVVVIQ